MKPHALAVFCMATACGSDHLIRSPPRPPTRPTELPPGVTASQPPELIPDTEAEQAPEQPMKCPGEGPTGECCNGADDDGDGKVDEDVGPAGLCYTGPIDTYLMGTCRPGAWLCRGGSFVCAGEILPQAELGNDEDCSGIVEAVPDLVIAFDVSGSAQSWGMPLVRDGYVNALERGPLRAFRVSLILLAQPDGYWTVIADSVSADQGRAILQGPLVMGYGGSEPSYDLLYELCTGGVITWRSSIRQIHLFADEAGQSNIGRAEAEVAAACKRLTVTIWGRDQMDTYDTIGVTRKWDSPVVDIGLALWKSMSL